MKAICKANNGRQLSVSILSQGSTVDTEFDLELGQSYVVYGIQQYKDVLYYFIIGKDENLPSWYPAELFDLSESLLPLDWHFNYFGDSKDYNVTAILGYRELALDVKHHDDLLERKSEAVKLFLDRKKEIDNFIN